MTTNNSDGNAYRRAWDAEASTEDKAKVAIASSVPIDQFWESGRRDVDRFILPYIKAKGSYLDYGCGIGRLAKAIEAVFDFNCHVTGADVSPKMLEMFGLMTAGEPQLVSGDGSLPFPDDSFDAVWSLLVLQHMERSDAFRALVEFHRVLHSNGRLIVSFPNLLSESYRTLPRQHLDHAHATAPGRVRAYTESEVLLLMSEAGFACKLLAHEPEIVVVAVKLNALTP